MDELADYPDKCSTEYILQGIQSGFQIGYDRHHYLMPATPNLTIDNPQAVTKYLSKEVALGKMWKVHVSKCLHTSPLGMIPIKNKPGKWQLIVELSREVLMGVLVLSYRHFPTHQLTTLQR